MPRPWFSKSAFSLCCNTMVRCRLIVAVSTTQTSPPVDGVVVTLAVLSPGSGGVTKRDT
jgi:hypothetical protein